MDLNETYRRIGEYIESHPSETYAQIGATLGLGRSQVARIARLQGIKRRPGKWPSALEAAVAAIEAASQEPDCALAGEAATPPKEETISDRTGCSASGGHPLDHAWHAIGRNCGRVNRHRGAEGRPQGPDRGHRTEAAALDLCPALARSGVERIQ